jgi:hypothetical protein
MQVVHLSSLIISTSLLNNTKLKNDYSNSYDIHFKLCLQRRVIHDENKTRSHFIYVLIFLNQLNLLYI